MAAQESATGVVLSVPAFPHTLFLFPPKIDIDGRVCERPWGTHFFPLPSGKHTVRLCLMYLFMPWRFEHSVDVVVEDGKKRAVKFWMPPWRTGSLRVD